MTDFSAFAARLAGFDWDRGNAEKNWARHAVTRNEAEEVFFHEPVLLAEDDIHSTREPRYLVLGRTAADRRLAVIFTVRRDLVRVISARPMSRKERTLYAKIPHEAP